MRAAGWLQVRSNLAPSWLGPMVMLWPLLSWLRDMRRRASWAALKRCFISSAPRRVRSRRAAAHRAAHKTAVAAERTAQQQP